MFSCFIQVSWFCFFISQDKEGNVQLQNNFPCILLEVASDEHQLLDPAEVCAGKIFQLCGFTGCPLGFHVIVAKSLNSVFQPCFCSGSDN